MVLLLVEERNVVRPRYGFPQGHHGCLLVCAVNWFAKASPGSTIAGVVAADVRTCSERTP